MAKQEAQVVRAYIGARRRRDKVIGADGIFADPAWDILLDLFASELEGKRICVTSACIAACVPSTTGLRWVKELTDRGLIERRPDPSDSRRNFVHLSDKGLEAMDAYFDWWCRQRGDAGTQWATSDRTFNRPRDLTDQELLGEMSRRMQDVSDNLFTRMRAALHS